MGQNDHKPQYIPSIFKNIFEDIRFTNSEGFLVEQAINSGTESRIGTEISFTYSPLKWLTLTGEMNYYNFEQKEDLIFLIKIFSQNKVQG